MSIIAVGISTQGPCRSSATWLLGSGHDLWLWVEVAKLAWPGGLARSTRN